VAATGKSTRRLTARRPAGRRAGQTRQPTQPTPSFKSSSTTETQKSPGTYPVTQSEALRQLRYNAAGSNRLTFWKKKYSAITNGTIPTSAPTQSRRTCRLSR
jgi:hypothetical protein